MCLVTWTIEKIPAYPIVELRLSCSQRRIAFSIHVNRVPSGNSWLSKLNNRSTAEWSPPTLQSSSLWTTAWLMAASNNPSTGYGRFVCFLEKPSRRSKTLQCRGATGIEPLRRSWSMTSSGSLRLHPHFGQRLS
ncbi:MAG: hypothetical protein ABIJ65_11180 [Chloroflexota bacterium]